MMKVIMHFDRFRLQTAIESNLGCTDLTKWSNYRQNFLNFEVNASNHDFLLTCLHKDGLDNFYKGLYSISNGLFNRSLAKVIIENLSGLPMQLLS